ncbi:MAG: phosphate acetyltransferase [Sulfurimonas sp. RIFOXYD12_FULL_33_39]|uniref:phosphate acetyltransferase n=1 Tax=unclassified Sulfurimonas TaxID=2623549 RepID=UPI0008B56D82|nr:MULTISPECIES: phosphate acetyltransferase [unclassified Sulfurimonas]OHE10840.1 MAG: phosphate acetyltransferase [Sulfurimonas sp. RIFOXYD12_FULL_33_39]OHE13390.1 MAG: phosphate acetyltransferase [Sulfurimonas sp. RIFOXYD2_FULL_34_21]
MKIKSLYISGEKRNVGTLFVSFGMMEILKRNIHRVAFFRPIIFSKDVYDKDIDFILKRYNLDMKYEDTYGFDIDYVESMIASKQLDELINQLIEKFKKLEKSYDFILCQGIRRSFLNSTIGYDLNMTIAQNFGSAIINIINAKDLSIHEIYENILIESENIRTHDCSHFATFVNRLDDEKHLQLKEKLKNNNTATYLLKEVKELDIPTIEDVMDALHAKPILFLQKDNTRVVRGFKIATQSVENFLEQLQEDDMVVVSPDRSDIILAIISTFYSKEYPKISGIVLTSDMQIHPNIQKIISGLKNYNVPILSVKIDAFQTAKSLLDVYSRLRVTSERKIALALGLFNSSADIKAIEAKIETQMSEVMTPMMFEYKLFEMARLNKKRVILPEGSDERILRAVEIILRRDAADIIILGDEDEIRENIRKFGLDLSKALIIDHLKSELLEEFTNTFYEMRKEKGLTLQGAKDAMIHVNYFATMMVYTGHADGMVSGAVHATADTIRPALQIIKTTPDVRIVSSLFFMCLKTKVLVYGDCALNQDPNAEELAQIALSCAKTALAFGIEPRVAMLSYSTGESGSGKDVDKVREATKIVKSIKPDLNIEGPIQYDAAIDKKVASIKLPNSKVAGEASVFIFPDLNTGNNTYKAVQRSTNAVAIGPILQGLKKPVNDLSRGCGVSDIVNTILITAIQAGQK